MYKLQVTADKLNIRSTPVVDPTNVNWLGDMTSGEVFTAINLVKGSNGSSDDWYVDNLNRYVSAAWVIDVTGYQDWMINLRLAEIWKKSTGAGVGVAVVDTGINTQNPDLLYDKNNNYIFDKTISLEDTNGHGTHCAGLISARNKNGNIIGISPGCNLYVCKISEEGSLSEPDTTRYADAIDWCANQDNIQVISISWASFINDQSIITQIQNSVNNAVQKNKVIVCAMGDASQFNDPGPLYPAALDNVIGIGSIPVENILYPYINKSLTLIMQGFNIPSYYLNNQIVQMSGTSQSNAIIAGLIALIIEKQKFNYSQVSIKDILLGVSPIQTFGKIQIPVIDGNLLLKYFQA